MKTSPLFKICSLFIIAAIMYSCEKEDIPFGQFTDNRDGKTYKTVQIGKQVWMAENLNYETSGGSWVYDNNSSNASTYGRLYDWETAKDVCPSGWHLPSDEEWMQLEMAIGISQKDADVSGARGANEGTKLKATSGWNNSGNGTDGYGFKALPGGSRNQTGDFGKQGDYAYFWSSTAYNSVFAWGRNLYCSYDDVYRYSYDMDYGFSVRCVKGPPPTPAPPLPPVADFIAERTTFTIDQGTVQFRDQSTNHPASRNWDFGDGTTSSKQNPKHSYTASGTYTVSLTVTNAVGTDTETKSDFITVTPGITTQTGSFSDSRDGKTYQTVTIGTQTWMAENLAYLPSVSPPTEGTIYGPYYYVNGYEGTSVSEARATDNYATYGVLYNWPAAMDACPDGWHLPTDDEWTQLTDYLTANNYYDLGNVLKSTSWHGLSKGDYLSFTALPGGFRFGTYGRFGSLGFSGYWWSSTEYRTEYLNPGQIEYAAMYRFMGSDISYVYRQCNGHKSKGFSVRCLKDY